MRHLTSFRPFPWIATTLAVGIICGACGDDDPPPTDTGDDQGTATDTGADAADQVSSEPSSDAAMEEEAGEPLLEEATATVGEATVRVTADPFGIQIESADGDVRVSTRSGEEPWFSTIAIGRATAFSQNRYYDPTLPANDGAGHLIQWFNPSALQSSLVDGNTTTLVFATADEAGEAGPDVTLVVASGESMPTIAVSVEEEPSIVHTALVLEAREGEGYYGLGEHFDQLDSRGLIREMQIQVTSDMESGLNEIHVPVPFVISTERYGVFADSRTPGAFDLAATLDDAFRITFDTHEMIFAFSVSDDPLELVELYTEETGFPAHVPFWALAPQWWRNENRDADEVLDDARRAREQGMASTLVWIDRPWSSYYHNWRFNPAQFPDPEGMVAALHDMGFRLLLHHSPQMNPPGSSDIDPEEDASEGLYRRYLDNRWLVGGATPVRFPWGGGDGAMIDWSHPDAVTDQQTLLRRVTDLGVVGVKMDWDEYLQANIGELLLPIEFANGETNFTMKNWYSALYHRAMFDGFNDGLGEPSFHINRSGGARDQAWNPCIWPGDLDNDFTEHSRGPTDEQDDGNVGGMPAAIVANQSLGMSGYPCFGSDIGGFRNGTPDEEVLLRWLAFGTFNGVMQLGGGGGSHMPWTADTSYSEEARQVTAKYFNLRMELVPYIFQYLLASQRTGRPLVRSLWFQFPDDASTRQHERDFMFGPDLLVAPVFQHDVTERTVYLPAGEWIDFWTGELIDSEGGTVVRPAPIDVIPVFVRAGALIPRAVEGIDTLFPDDVDNIVSYHEVTGFRLHVAPRGERTLEVYNGVTVTAAASDDLISVALEIGDPDDGLDPRFVFSPATVELMVETAGTAFEDGPAQVSVVRDGDETTLAEGTDCTDCWRFDDARGLLYVALGEEGEVRIE